jgi:hypothetical protein
VVAVAAAARAAAGLVRAASSAAGSVPASRDSAAAAGSAPVSRDSVAAAARALGWPLPLCDPGRSYRIGGTRLRAGLAPPARPSQRCLPAHRIRCHSPRGYWEHRRWWRQAAPAGWPRRSRPPRWRQRARQGSAAVGSKERQLSLTLAIAHFLCVAVLYFSLYKVITADLEIITMVRGCAGFWASPVHSF